MRTQKFVITDFSPEEQKNIQKSLDDGYRIVSMVSESVSCSTTGQNYTSKELRGKLAIVLEKE